MIQIRYILIILWKDRLQQAIQFINDLILIQRFELVPHYLLFKMDLCDIPLDQICKNILRNQT